MRSAHIGIKVSDIEKSLAFYVDGLGGTLAKEIKKGDMRIAFVKEGDTLLELVEQQRPPHHSDAIHLAFVVEDLEKTLEEFRSKGIDLGDGIPINFGEGCIFFFNGPDGERIELCQGVGTAD